MGTVSAGQTHWYNCPDLLAPQHSTRVSTVARHDDDATSWSGLTPPPEMLVEASRRLGLAALIYAVYYLLAYFTPHIAAWLTLPGHPFWRLQHVFAVFSIGLGFTVFALSRRATIPAQRLLDLGLVFEVVGALGIAAAEFWNGFPAESFLDHKFDGIPWEVIWILVFPLIAPNSPRKILIASLASASMGPLIVFSRYVAGVPIDRSLTLLTIFFLSTTYLCALLAYIIARVVYRYGVRLRKARDIGSYELVSKLGEGGMGEVWVGRHRMLARPAAIKLIRPELLGADARSRATAIRRFEREARATAALRSTHTIDVYDYGSTEDGAFYYVMEFLEGVNLDVLVRKFGPVSAARTIYLLRQVCHSLGEAHAHGLIHRDIKPGNIFSCRLGPDADFVKVLDFGLVKETSGMAESGGALTQQGVTAGTPAFMPPEIALGHPDVDGRADIYALGCVAYWLLTGHSVFQGDTPVATILAHVRATPMAPSHRSELAIPRELDDLIIACLAKDPADRPQSTDEVVRRLAAVPVVPWTADDARKWWALHGPIGTLTAFREEDLSPAAVVYARR